MTLSQYLHICFRHGVPITHKVFRYSIRALASSDPNAAQIILQNTTTLTNP